MLASPRFWRATDSRLRRHDARAPHFQGARLPAIDPRKLAARLIDNGVYASVRGDHLRVAPHLYTDDEDLARFDNALGTALG